MKKLLTVGLLLVVLVGIAEAGRRRGYGGYESGTGSNSKSTYVDPYTKKDGTYVPGHYRTAPNGTKKDNYGTNGNYNPHNGKWGSQDIDNN